MTPDMGRGVQSTIGPAGGTFSATGANGDIYSLTIPEGALFTDTTIAVIPVASARGLPEGAGPVSGVVLQPEGLALARTGWLEITLPPRSRPRSWRIGRVRGRGSRRPGTLRAVRTGGVPAGTVA
jgi:hypothetical protein